MAFDYQRLTEITTLAATAGAVYTHDTGTYTRSFIRLIVLHNGNTTNEVVKLYCVPDSTGNVGTAGVTNKFYEATLSPNETVTIELATPGMVLVDDNETIQGVTTTASKVTVQIYGGAE